MAQISVYLNALSSKSHSAFSEEELKKFFFRHDMVIHTPGSLDELNEQVLADVEKGTEYIFAVGGDGTMNTISQNLVGKKTKLMVLPTGTANDFAQELGMTNNLKKISKFSTPKRPNKSMPLKLMANT